jgi:hypothetical protein
MLKPFAVLAIAALSAFPAAPVLADPSPEVLYQRTCANVLNLLPRIVRKSEVAAIPNDANIVLHSICTGVELSDFGNAAGLRRSIAANHALSRALARRGYRADDVVALAIYGDTVQVYVHRSI